MDDSNVPRLAVLTPVFNDATGLVRTLESLKLQQVLFDWVIVDDGSQPAITVPDNLPFKVKLIRLDPNRGITSALNTGLSHIFQQNYDRIARLDAGDVALPGRFAKQMDAMDSNPQLGALGTWVRLVDEQDQPILVRELPVGNRAIRRRHQRTSGMVHSSVMLDASVAQTAGLYNDTYRYAEDFDLWLRIGRLAELDNLPEILLEVEVRPDSISTGRRKTQVASRMRLLRREFSFKSLGSYTGLIANVGLYLVSFSFSMRAKRLLQRSLGKSPQRRKVL
ncbi:glycosyltransferase [Rhodopirellula europaea]|uniref:glycosyltransferase n=1 Tax=Rhodopirellula europaea TaxID=1263866 RepID=UPI003D295E0B